MAMRQHLSLSLMSSAILLCSCRFLSFSAGLFFLSLLLGLPPLEVSIVHSLQPVVVSYLYFAEPFNQWVGCVT